ncbi:MAG TPA: Ricin and poly(3-hydroxybutyrate) depolymerase fusion [Polyangiaceae bacterium]|nr:Ricin and poly(3-hydroxybutyrate) depolymerase fusion [Polyangiaceae bacterium]
MQSVAHRVATTLTFSGALLGSLGCSNESGNSGSGGTSGAATTTAGSASTGTAGSAAAGGGAPNGMSSGGMPAIGAAGQASALGGSAGKASAGGAPSSAGSSNGTAGATTGVGGGGNGSAAVPSAGCGKAAGLKSGRASIDVAGTMREYILALPDNYDSSHPYRLVFGWHPWGGSAQQVASGSYYGLQKEAKGTAIFVAGEGLPFGDNGLGWGNTNGQDIALLDKMLDSFRAQLCIDESRIFSVGFSFGGMFSFAAGCSQTSMMRAIAPMAGNTSVAGCGSGSRPVAIMGFHGTEDEVVMIDGGRKGRDAFVQRNKCTSQTMPAQPTWCDVAGQKFQPCTCVSYQGCTEGYPVTWCEYNGQHMIAPNSGATVWNFFAQF